MDRTWAEDCTKLKPSRWKQVTGTKVEMEIKDQIDFAELLKDGSVLCQ